MIRSQSRFFQTPAFPKGSGPDFVNAAVAVESDLTPEALLQALHAIEAELGRERLTRWGQRTLDLDLLAVGDAVLPDRATHVAWRDQSIEQQMQSAPNRLVLPHPRLQDRSFVLVPLAEIAPDWVHPVSGMSVREMLDALPDEDKEGVSPMQ